jgi:hypothetical protein
MRYADKPMSRGPAVKIVSKKPEGELERERAAAFVPRQGAYGITARGSP